MQFAAISIAVGLAGTLLVSNLQGAVIVSGEDPVETSVPQAGGTVDNEAPQTSNDTNALRIIDLRRGMACRLAVTNLGATLESVTFDTDCRRAGPLSQIFLGRTDGEGTLIMADANGRTVMKFAPGDGVLYESIYPREELLTIIAAR